MKNNWRDNISPLLKDYFEKLLTLTDTEKQAFLSSKDKKNAQLWCALTIMYKENSDLKNRLNILERALKDSLNKKSKKKDTDPAKELKKVLEKL